MSQSSSPLIDSSWIIAMINLACFGVLFHMYFLYKSVRFYVHMNGEKKGIFIGSCILLLIFNTMACLIWALFRTNIMISLTVRACQAIYLSNFLCYFMGKYILHCLLIFRIYMTFRRSKLSMSLKKTLVFLIIISINSFVAMVIWATSVAHDIKVGRWVADKEYEICTLFSDQVDNHLMVKLSAIHIGIEDFIVGSVTFYIFLRRFISIAQNADDKFLLVSAIRFGVCAFCSVISTLFLFTLAIPFYPNFTFILAIDATINSLCLFCVISVGENLYKCLCFPCSLYGQRWVSFKHEHPDFTSRELVGRMFGKQMETGSETFTSTSIDIKGVNGVISATIGPAPQSLPTDNDVPVLKSISKSVNFHHKTNKELSTHLTTPLPSLLPSKSDPVRVKVTY